MRRRPAEQVVLLRARTPPFGEQPVFRCRSCPQARRSRPAAKSEFLRVSTSGLRASLQHYREHFRPSRPVGRGGCRSALATPSAAGRKAISRAATLNWPARARNASSSWLRRSADDGGKRRTTSSAASRSSLRAPRALRAAARAGWERRWWGQLGCALQRALASMLLGGCWRAPAQPTGDEHTPLRWVLELAEAEQLSRLPLRA